MRSDNLGFFLAEAFKNLRLNLLMSVTAVTTTAVCILILGIGLLVDAHVEGIVGNVGQDVTITAFFPEDIDQERIDEVVSSVESYPEVNESAYVSKEEALERFRETFADQPDIAGSISSDVLPASMEIQLKDSSDSSVVADRLREEGFQDDEIRYPQQTVDRLNQITGYLVWGLRGATALFFVASVLLIFNTIRLSIFARRKEIEVMKLVGASDSFVRTPFVFEGLAEGLIGAGLAALAVIWINFLFVDWANDALPYVPIRGEAVNTILVLVLLVAVGVAIGVVGSFLSVRLGGRTPRGGERRGDAGGIGAEAGGRRRLPSARSRRLAHRRILGRRLRLRDHAPRGVPGGPTDLRRVARGDAGLLRVRDLLRPPPLRVVRALQVLQALRLEGPSDLVAELGATVPGALLRLSTEVRLYPVDGP